ncbi:MAG: hypothetical protein IPP34_10295 [Bacteroidetes bacterium]|nr:hypothetical protein [Bacteroidota bacterium]
MELAKQQALRDAEEKRKRDIEALKEAYAKAAQAEKDSAASKDTRNTAALPTIDKDYPEGISEETLPESNRTIYRTVIRKATTQEVFSKVVYNWGGIFYFKNNTSLTESNYSIELKRMKDLLNQK